MNVTASLPSAWRLGRHSVKQFTRTYTPPLPYSLKQLVGSPSLDYLFDREWSVYIANDYFKHGCRSNRQAMNIGFAACNRPIEASITVNPNRGQKAEFVVTSSPLDPTTSREEKLNYYPQITIRKFSFDVIRKIRSLVHKCPVRTLYIPEDSEVTQEEFLQLLDECPALKKLNLDRYLDFRLNIDRKVLDIASRCAIIRRLTLQCYNITSDDIPKILNLFSPGLEEFGNYAPMHRSKEEVLSYLQLFANPEIEAQQNKPLLRYLDLSHVEDVDDEFLEEIHPYLQVLHKIALYDAKITKLGLPKAIEVDCRNCPALTTLKAPHATKVDCSDCTTLKTLSIPEAQRIDCRNCETLLSINAPNATEVNCIDCPALTSLTLPSALDLFCSNSRSLEFLEAPMAEMILAIYCTSLKSIKAPEVTHLDCRECKELISIEASSVVNLATLECRKLTSIEAPLLPNLGRWNYSKFNNIKPPVAKYWLDTKIRFGSLRTE